MFEINAALEPYAYAAVAPSMYADYSGRIPDRWVNPNFNANCAQNPYLAEKYGRVCDMLKKCWQNPKCRTALEHSLLRPGCGSIILYRAILHASFTRGVH